MPQTVVAWLESEDRSGASTFLAAVPDNLLVVDNDNLRFRKDVKSIALAYVWSDDATYPPVEMRLSAPTISGNPIRFNRGIGLNFLGGGIEDFRDNPLNIIVPGDNVTAFGFEEDEAGNAHYLGLALVLSDGIIPKGPRPQLTHIHQCAVTAISAGVWTLLPMTETDALPAGEYEMYGASVMHSGIMAARFKFLGMELEPAVIPINDVDEVLHPLSLYWGKPIRFTIPDGLPDIRILEVVGSGTVTIQLYLRKVA